MEEGAKRRLIGAAVMVVLLVIFIPMLVEEEPSRPVSEREMSVPPRPDFDQGYDASVLENPVESSPVSTFLEYEEPPEGSIPEDSPPPRELPPPALFEPPATIEPKVTPEPAPVLVEERPPAAKPKPAPKPPPAPEPKPAPEPRSTPKPTPAPKATSAAKPVPARPSTPARASSSPANSSTWVIQVASLRERGRAYAIVQKLRAQGFPAYLEEARVNRELWHRIRVGPEPGRKRIESMAASLRAKTGMKGQIQRYP